MNPDYLRLSRLILTISDSRARQLVKNHVDPSRQVPKHPKPLRKDEKNQNISNKIEKHRKNRKIGKRHGERWEWFKSWSETENFGGNKCRKAWNIGCKAEEIERRMCMPSRCEHVSSWDGKGVNSTGLWLNWKVDSTHRVFNSFDVDSPSKNLKYFFEL